MPLSSGPGSMKSNIRELTTGKVGAARKKGIKTFARTHGISEKQARVEQAWIIAKSKLKTKRMKHQRT